ncbi:MAG: gliding motility-associated ABC transporter substrate-binding protein GldG, partial [Flammeovirgaceae bacterium]
MLFTSPYSRKLVSPVKVGVNDLRKQLREGSFNAGPIPIAYLLEGKFSSLFANRFAPEAVDTAGFVTKSKETKIIVVADGDMARNDINPRQNEPQTLGYDPFTRYTFANQDLLLNMIAYLTNENGLIAARNKEVKIRPLDKEKIRQERTYWQAINILLPLLALAAFGLCWTYLRKRKDASF